MTKALRGAVMMGCWLSLVGCEDAPAPKQEESKAKPAASAATAKPKATAKTEDTKPAATAKPKEAPKEAATAEAAPEPAPAGDGAAKESETLKVVDPAKWRVVIGPKLPPGSVVMGKVLRGWPRKFAMVFVTKENDNFKLRVLDDRMYSADKLGPANRVAKSMDKIEFFDVDGDGKPDAVMLSTFEDKEGTKHRHNHMVKWTGTSLEQMRELEKKVGTQETMAAIKSKTGG